MATLKDIAEATGVSVATISRVLNNNPHVSEDKRALILKAVADLDYKFSSRAAKGGKAGRRNIIAVTSNFGFWGEMFRGMAEAANDLGYSFLIYFHPYTLGVLDLPRFNEDILSRHTNTAGIIMANKELDDETYFSLRDRLPIVFCGQYFRPKGACSISSDDESAAFELVEHLISTGKRRIAIIRQADKYTSDNFTTLQEERIFGYRRALEKHGIEFDESLIFTYEDKTHVDDDFMAKVVNSPARPDGIFCIHGYMAVQTMHLLHNLEVQVPDSVAVVGFDNDRDNIIPGITTIKQNYYDFGMESVKTLDSLINKAIVNGRKIYIDHELIVSNSTMGKLSHK